MDRDPSTTGAMRGARLCRAHVLTTLSVGPHQRTSSGGQRTLPAPGTVSARQETRKPGVAVGDHVGTRQSGVFPGRAIPGMLDGRGVSGDGQRTLPSPAMPTLMVPAVRLVRVTAGMARGRRERARAEVAG